MTTRSVVHQRLFACGVLLGVVAEQMVLFAIPLLIFQDTKEVSALGLAYAIEWLPALLAYPFAGLLADRDGGARLFSVVTAGRAVVLGGALIGCLAAPSLLTPILMTAAPLLSLFMAPARMSVEKVVPQLAKGTEVAKMQGLVQSMEVSAMAIGPALALLGLAVIDKTWLLGAAAVIFAAAAACWLPLPRGLRTSSKGGAAQIVVELRLGWTLLVRSRPLVLLASLNFSINLVFAVVLAANAALVTGVFHAPESSFALLNICIGVLGIVNLLVIPFLLRHVNVRILGIFGLALLCSCLLLIGFASSMLLYAPAFVAAMLGVTYFNVFNRTQRIKVLPEEHLGKVMGPFYLLNMMSMPIAGLLLAGSGNNLGPQRLVLVLAVALTAFGALMLPLIIQAFGRAIAAREATLVGATAE
ncbi:MFS transporter [Streptomyces sp. V1I1]|uniref:MFS transporter n=1 Tax=Streptomyces sp. V1I1 TaxID=3042272 RepID=UPI0027857A12|nr:MFS transporter [Streptomyces sp. V1I1]MDQ0943891.1 MFS family permease [Streptomyces sp. V1I1]